MHTLLRILLSFLATATLLAGEIRPASGPLDGGGHWGTKNDSNWVDGRWNNADVGPMMSCTLPLDGSNVLTGISVKVSAGPATGTLVFDSTACGIRGGWLGGFLTFSPKRFGVIEHPRPAGAVLFSAPKSQLWNRDAVYTGLSRHAQSVLFHYRVGGTEIAESGSLLAASEHRVFARRIALAAHDEELTLRLAQLSTSKVQFALAGESRATLTDDAGILTLKIPPSSTAHDITVLCAATDPSAWRARSETLLKVLPSFAALREAGPRLFADEPAAKGAYAASDKGLAFDDIPLPFKNASKALLFLTGLDFFPNGDAAVCTLHGDVWIVKGLDEKLENIVWTRHATGLFQPLGLKIVNGAIHVLGRDQITNLEDTNNDGEADRYHTFFRNPSISAGNHDYAACLETDSKGNLYFVCPKGLHRVSADGRSHDIVATGWRNPITLSIGPDDTPTVAPQEGEWTPAQMIFSVKPGGYYGFPGPKVSRERPRGYDAPLCWLPRQVDNSSGGHVWVNSAAWGPLQNRLVNLSFGRSAMQFIHTDGAGNAAIVPVAHRFPSGVCRGRFNPRDGQLYVLGTQGWATNANLDGCFQRVRRTDKPLGFPVSARTFADGVQLTFDTPMDRADAEDIGAYLVEAWQYKYSAKYGSDEFALSSPETKGRDEWTVSAARLSPDGCSLFLSIAEFQPAQQMQIKYKLRQASGEKLSNEVVFTVHTLPLEKIPVK